MKRAVSFLLAVIMVCSLVPAAAVAANTGDVTVQAYQTAGNRLIEVDGEQKEVFWLLDTPVGSSALGALCDIQNVYFAFETAATTARLTVNGVNVSCTLGAAPTTSVGTIAGKDGFYELVIPVASLNTKIEAGKQVGLAVTLGSDSVKGTLVLAQTAVIAVGNSSIMTGADYYAGMNTSSSDATGNIVVTEDGTFTFKNDGDAYYRVTTKTSSSWASMSGNGFMLAFEADFNDLPTTTDTSKLVANFGLFWYIIAGSARHDMSFWSDENGQIMFSAKQNSLANARKNALATGIFLGTPEAQKVRVRILLDTDNNINLYINGVKIGTIDACPAPSTSAGKQFCIYVDHRKKTSERVVDVVWRDLTYQEFSVAKTKTAEDKVTYPVSTGLGLEDVEAKLRTGAVKLDGTADEAQWYLDQYPAQRAGSAAPSTAFGLLWDNEYLYLGFQDFDKAGVEKLGFSTNGKVEVTADPAAGTASVGEFLFDPYANTGEWKIPMSALGMKGQLNETVEYSVSFTGAGGVAVQNGTMTLSGTTIIMGDTFDDLATKSYVVTGTAPGTQLMQGERSADYVSDPNLAGNELHQMFKAVDFDGGAYVLELDLTFQSLPAIGASYGWRGFCIELREPELQSRFNFRDGGSGNVVMDILYQNGYETWDTGLSMGERAKVRIEVDKNEAGVLYINDRKVATLTAQDRSRFTINDTYPMPRMIIQAVNHNRVADSAGQLNEVNVQIHDLLMSQPTLSDPVMRLEKALEQLSEKTILAGNTSLDNVTSDLKLPASVALSQELTYTVTWTAADLAGVRSSVVNTATGKVTPAAGTSYVVLTASITDGTHTATRAFELQVRGSKANSNVYFLTNDDMPTTGGVTSPTGDAYVLFDTDHNSVVYDQGSAKRFNTITLYDSDETSRVSQNDLGVFVSNDGKTFTKVTGWLLHQSGKVYTLYNLDQTARYIKVHTYLDGLNDPDDSMSFAPSFYNNVSDLIRVEYTENLLGAKGKFACSAVYTASNATDKQLRDEIVYISLEQLGAKAGQYRSDCADFRFVADGKQLPYWYDGEDGFYVRVLTMPAKGSVDITVRWGNVSAGDVSDREAVFEAVYGNVSLIDLTEKTDLVASGRAFTFPNGTVIAVSRNDDSDLTAVFSYDGGRTFTPVGVDLIPDGHYANNSGFGSYIWDAKNQRLILMAYAAKVKSDDYNLADCRFVYLYTDDYGKTWSQPRVLSDANAIPATNNDIIIQNSQGRLYQLSYCDGLTLRDADGAGPNVDYVVTHSYVRKDGTMAGAAIFSKDGGESWIASEGSITMDVAFGHENGISETAFAQLDDGSLYIVARAQSDDNTFFYESYSYDYGNTWTQGAPSKVISTNTSPVFLPYGSDRLLMWAGNNTLGGNARRRFPMTLAISGDNYKTYDRSLNLTLGMAYDTLEASIEHITQPSLSLSPDGSEAFVCWTNLRQSTTVGMLIEDFGEMIYHTKGAYDAFESTALKGEGWLEGDHYSTGYGLHVAGDAFITDEQANTGNQSMKLLDDSTKLPGYVLRQIPSMRKGTIGMSVMVPSSNTTDYVVELKHAYNYTYGEFTMAGFGIKPDGTVYLADGKNTVVSKVAPGSWNDYAIEFDMEGSKKGTLYINDKKIADFDLIINSDRITVVEVGERSASATTGSCVYVDDFYATEASIVRNGKATPAGRNAQVSPVSFHDVASGDWYAKAVSYATENGLMSGYNADTFGANDTLTRAQVVQVLYNKEGTPALNGATHKFPDVAANQWYNNAVTWGAARKVVSGYGDGRFGPDDTVTLEQAAVILWNYSGTPAAEGSLDAIGAHSDWAANALRWAVQTGLFEGMPYGAMTNGATRAQTAQMLMNYLAK